MNEQNVRVVLVEPQGSLNIGSVARVMANFGFGKLYLVNPEADHLNDEARRMAVKAAPLLEQAVIVPDLAAALADCRLALGTTRRFGKYREDFLHPDELGPQVVPVAEAGEVALVFGREDKGLLTEELDLCQRFITIPTSDELPSMNLAQSVAVSLYGLVLSSRNHEGENRHGRKSLASGQTLERLYDHMRRTLLDIEYLDPQNPEHILHTYRRIFGRAQLNDREVRVLRGLLSRIDWVEAERRKGLKDKLDEE
ncbi:MAG: RNA methyltransferase [Desulfuromonas sp.]|nr:MAG: RNA methyltransferase [Desulfuromonas sp.]